VREFYLRENRVKVFIYVFLLILLTIPNKISKTEADVMPLDTTGAGNFIPMEDCSLIMTNASVTFEINYSKTSNKIFLSFNGNYTIYNPANSIMMTLLAPFSEDFKNLESTCLIKSEDNTIPFSFLERDLDDYTWEEYISGYTRKLLVIDMDFPENDSIELEYTFDAYLNIKDYHDSVLRIIYDVGTSRAWNGTITERVEFNVYKKQPDSYLNSSYDNYEFMIFDIEDGQSYVWEWKNEMISANNVYISYSYYNSWRYAFGKILLILFYPLLIIALIAIVVLSRKRRHKRKIKENFAS